MKKITTAILLLFFIVGMSYGQMHDRFWWFDAGVKVQYGATGFLNSALLSDNPDWNYEIGTGLGYGIKLGVNKGSSGFTIDVIRSTAKQPFENTPQNDPVIKWTSTELYTMYRNSRQLGYFEIGPKFSFLNEVSSSNFDEPFDKNNFTSTEISAAVGFGAYFIGSGGRFSGILGLRFEYGITDMVKEAGGAEQGLPVGDVNLYNVKPYSATHPVFAGLVFELNWGIGYYGQASCGGRNKFIML